MSEAEKRFLEKYDSCDPAPARGFVGRIYDPAQDAEYLKLTGAGGIRVIRPGEAIAMDYSSGRLNVELDGKGAITRFWCG